MKIIHHTKYENNQSIFDNSQNCGYKMWNFGHCQKCSNFAPIWCVKSTHKKNYHTQFEQTWSIFDNVQKFVPRSKLSKLLRFCSNSMSWILFVSWFYWPNMSKFRAFLTMSKMLRFDYRFFPQIWEFYPYLRQNFLT